VVASPNPTGLLFRVSTFSLSYSWEKPRAKITPKRIIKTIIYFLILNLLNYSSFGNIF
jgi:hypothetical protein